MMWKEGLAGLIFMPCLFHAMTGFYCPGCGGTRAVAALLRGDLVSSFCYHPLVLYGAAACVFWLTELFAFGTEKRNRPRPVPGKYLAYGAVGITLINFVVKNCLLVCGIDLLAGGW